MTRAVPTLHLNPDRLLPAAPGTGAIARRLYDDVRDLPIISPHGHVDPRLLVDEPFADPASWLGGAARRRRARGRPGGRRGRRRKHGHDRDGGPYRCGGRPGLDRPKQAVGRVEEPPLCRVRVRRGRVVIPRRDVAARIMLALLVVGYIAVRFMWTVDDTVDQASIVIAAGLFGPLVILFALLGFASRVVVTPAELVVYTVYTRCAVHAPLSAGCTGPLRGRSGFRCRAARR